MKIKTPIFIFFFLLIFSIYPDVSAQNQTKNHSIAIDKAGFSPKEYTIQVGDTIHWENKDERSHWPASNFHPTHANYPEKTQGDCLGSAFDSCKGLEQGESWSFTFTKVGSWHYHDHLFPGLTGVVHVEEINQPYTQSFIQKIKTWFKKKYSSLTYFFSINKITQLPTQEEFLIYSEAKKIEMIERLSSKSPKEAWEYLKKVSTKNGEVVNNSHELAHIIGNAAFDYGGIPEIKICDNTFAFGCYHGVTEKFLIEGGPEKTSEIAIACKSVFPNQKDRVLYTSCIHGMGHGLLTWYGLDMKSALFDCDVLEEKDRQYCYDGVFMEYSTIAPPTEKPNDPWGTCAALDENYYISCGRYQLSIFRSVYGFSFEESANTCLRAPNDTLQEHCMKGLGFFAGQNSKDDTKKIITMCNIIENENFKNTCIIAAAGEIVFQEYKNWNINSKKLCTTLETDIQTKCFERIELLKKQYNK